MDNERKGHKICDEKAENIRQIVRLSIKSTGRLPERVAQALRNDARVDASLHKGLRDNFTIGGGPAVKKP